MDRLPVSIKLIISIAVPLIGGFLSGLASMSNVAQFYAKLAKPSFSPPGWLFGPAWTILYILMGVAAFLIWQKGLDAKGVIPALIVFLIQLAINFSWSPVFFGLQSIAGGLILIIILWLAIIVTIVLFWRLNYVAGVLLLPYLLWVTFATVLNFYIWQLN